MKQVALTVVRDDRGRILFGRRRDNGLWTVPGGGMKRDESPEEGARRELKEETDLDAASLEFVGAWEQDGAKLHAFTATVRPGAKATPENDPDHECLFWRWVDCSDGVPKDIAAKCAGPENFDNFLYDMFGMKKSERYHQPALEDLVKEEPSAPRPHLGKGAPRLIMIRHGATDFNSGTAQEPTERLRGWLDVPLNDQGRREAQQAGAHLRGVKVQAVFASDLDRTLETARIVDQVAQFKVPVQPAPQLRPWHLGEMHGQPMTKVLPQMLYYLDHEDETPPGGEPFVNFHRRALSFIIRLAEMAKANPAAGAVVLVSHSREARLIKGWVQGGCRPDGAIDKGPILSKEEAAKTGHLLVLQFNGNTWEMTDERALGHHHGEDSPSGKVALPMVKAEDDEVDRMLQHPDPVERRLALKLGSVKSKHLVRALAGDDHEVQRQALAHPAMDHAALLALMQMPNREHLQLLGLQHPAAAREHVEALYHAHKGRPAHESRDVMHAVSHHPAVDSSLIEKMVGEGHGHGVVENLNAPPYVLAQLVESHLMEPRHDGKRAMARRALRHPRLDPALAARAFKEGPLDVKVAIAGGPHMPEDLAQDVLVRGLSGAGDNEAFLRSAVISSPRATRRHLETAARDRNPIVRHAARQKLGMAKFESDRSRWLGEQLRKAVVFRDYASVSRALDPKGAELVDHKPDLEAHPPEHGADVHAYRQHVLESPDPVKRRSGGGRDNGITRKLMYQLPAEHPTHANVQYMVKPYHERISQRLKKWSRHPHQGWAEMTNQALYHAGGIGNLHQAVHVSEHRMGNDLPAEPALVVRMDPGYDIVHKATYANKTSTEETKDDVRKIALMDFLTNNLDRHGGNLLYKTNAEPVYDRDRGSWGPETRPNERHASSVKAIDHSRSFQYHNVHSSKWRSRRDQPAQMEDDLKSYVTQSALNNVVPLVTGWNNADRYKQVDDWQRAIDWWEQASPKVRATMSKRLEQIRDPEVRKHVQRNFDARADQLDQMAEFGLANFGVDWYDTKVPLYRPGELSDEEKQDQERDAGAWRNYL